MKMTLVLLIVLAVAIIGLVLLVLSVLGKLQSWYKKIKDFWDSIFKGV